MEFLPTLAERSRRTQRFFLALSFFPCLLARLPSCMPASFPPSFFLLARSARRCDGVVHLYLFQPSPTVGLEDARHGCLLSLPHLFKLAGYLGVPSRDEKQTVEVWSGIPIDSRKTETHTGARKGHCAGEHLSTEAAGAVRNIYMRQTNKQ